VTPLLSNPSKGLTKLSPDELRALLREDTAWARANQREREWRDLRIAWSILRIRDKMCWREWQSAETKKKFETFTQWLAEECQIGGRSKVYDLMGVVENLKLPPEKLLEFGKTKCYELVKVAKNRPKQLAKMVSYLEKNPELPVDEVKQSVANVLSGQAMGSRKFVRVELLVAQDAIPTFRKGIAVMQAISPVSEPQSAIGQGLLLSKVCQEYLSGKVETKVLKELEAAGAFETTRFQLEE
jgi:hypothetical protein